MSQPLRVPRSIRRSGEFELEIKKSRFLCALARVETEVEVRDFVHARRRQHFSARHHCTAFVLGDAGEVQRSSDDGEPAGTAGVPMLEVLRKRGLTNTAAVVTRYFGGVKLGAGGLIRAYSSAVADAVDAVGVVERRPVLVVSAVVDYLQSGRVENELRTSPYPIREVDYGDDVRFTVAVAERDRPRFEAWLAELTGGAAVTTVDGADVVEVEVPAPHGN